MEFRQEFQEGMDSMIKKLYVNLMKGKKELFEQEYREEILNMLEKGGEKKGRQEYEDMAFLIAAMAEENGFVKGFRYAFYLFTECIWE